MPKIIMLRGLPSSSKSTWAKEQLKKGGIVHVSVDVIRELYGGWAKKRETDVLKMRNAMIREGIAQGRNVIVDATNLNPKHERTLRALAEELGARFEINDSFLEVSPEECIKRDLHRGERAVGSAVIWDMYYRWLAPKTNPLRDNTKPRCVLVDIDGTLALNKSGRSFYDMTKVENDTLDPFVGCIVDALYNYGIEMDGTPYPKVIICSGRSEDAREATMRWLSHNMIPYDELYMRKEGDKRDDVIVKEEIYHTFIEPKYAVLGVFDDRPKVSRMYRKLGLRVAQLGTPEVEF